MISIYISNQFNLFYTNFLKKQINIRAIWRNNVQTIYFAGYFVGSIIMGILADHFGRRPIMLSSFVMIIIGSLGVALGPQEKFGSLASYILYAISRFIIACGTRGINVTGFVLG